MLFAPIWYATSHSSSIVCKMCLDVMTSQKWRHNVILEQELSVFDIFWISINFISILTQNTEKNLKIQKKHASDLNFWGWCFSTCVIKVRFMYEKWWVFFGLVLKSDTKCVICGGCSIFFILKKKSLFIRWCLHFSTPPPGCSSI